MIIVGDKLVSEDIIEKKFLCNLEACKGACCIEGDAGAPLAAEELPMISMNVESIADELPEANKELLNKSGFYEIDVDGEPVTTCLPDGTCVFALRDKLGILKCGIEEAHRKGTSSFLKPVSCHLYPVRVSNIGEYEALNYHHWDICSPACDLGNKKGVRVFEFVGQGLIRKFGKEWYSELLAVAEAHLGDGDKNNQH